MADIETLKELRKRVLATRTRDAHLDADIINTVLQPELRVLWPEASPITHSVDAALWFVKRSLPGWIVWDLGQTPVFNLWGCSLVKPGLNGAVSKAADADEMDAPALALVAAALVGLIAEMEAETPVPALTKG